MFPFPFTIFSLIVLGAGLVSKLQNQNTYLIGLGYSVLGVVETAVVGYVLYSYFYKYEGREWLTVCLMLGGLGVIALLNVLACVVQTATLCSDKRFHTWTRSTCPTTITFLTITLLSTLTNHKLRLILFTRLFNLPAFKAPLTST